MSNPDDLLASFYGSRRAWTPGEIAAAKALIQHHGWTGARATFIAEWIDENIEGRFWRHLLSSKDGIVGVLKAIATITEKSGAAQAAAPWPPEAYAPQPRSDEDEAQAQALARTTADKIAAVQKPWGDLIDEARSKGLRGAAMFDWVMDQRAQRTGRPRSDYPTSRQMTRDLAKSPADVSSPRHWTEHEEAKSDADE